MKTNAISKIAILIFAITIATGAVLYFIKTIVAPPTDIEVRNLHIASIETDISNFTDNMSPSYNDSLYTLIADKINVFHADGFLNGSEKDEKLKEFILAYTHIFKSRCITRFNSRGWDDADFPQWRKRVKELLGVKLSDGQKVITGSYKNDLNNIVGIMDEYKNAKAIASISTYSSVETARSNISSADNYASRTYLDHSKLVSSLRNVKVKIGNSHYRQLTSRVNSLSGYRGMTENEFESLSSQIHSEIREYEDNKRIYGSAAKTQDEISVLKSDAAEYVSAAHDYYESLITPSVRVFTNSGWTEGSSPNSAYKQYKSYSNLGVHDSTSQMYFEISGYTSFTFYIDSYAESTCDYVMVGYLNSVPTQTNNYANTSGWQKSPTNFGNYKTVTFDNLTKTETYRIYVSYRKDGSEHRYDDRGYILLPNIAQ